MMGSWWDALGKEVWDALAEIGGEVREQGLLPLLRPVAPFNRPALLAPVVTAGALVSFLLLSGVAVSALGALLLAVLGMYLLLAQVFGFSLELHPFRVA